MHCSNTKKNTIQESCMCISQESCMCISLSCSSLSDVSVQISGEKDFCKLQYQWTSIWLTDDTLVRPVSGERPNRGSFHPPQWHTPFSLVPKPYFPKLRSLRFVQSTKRYHLTKRKYKIWLGIRCRGRFLTRNITDKLYKFQVIPIISLCIPRAE